MPSLVTASRPSKAVIPAKQAPQKRDCRIYERHPCGITSQCQPASSFGRDDLKWAATLENISQSGVCLNLRRRFEPGTGLAIELPGKAPDDSYTVLAKVVHVQRQESGFWFLGCQFVSELSDDEMQRLLPIPATPSAVLAKNGSRATEKRARERTKCRGCTFGLRSRSTTIGCVIPQFAAAAFWPLAAGSIGVLKGNDAKGGPWKLTVRVRDCHFEGENWNLDCKLLNAPAKHELLRALGDLVVRN